VKSFVKILFIFILLLWILAFSIDEIISIGLKKTDIRKFQAWNDIYASDIKDDVVIIGSSRAWCQYDPKILDSITGLSFYNLGIDGSPINYQIIRYNTYRRFNPKPKYIVQNVDFLTLAIRNDGYEREQYFPYIDDDSLINVVAKDKNISFLDRYIPLVRYFGYRDIFEDGFESYFGKTVFFDGGLYKGYRGNDYQWDGSNLRNVNKINYSKDPKALKLLDEYLSKAKDENIEVIFVSAPVYDEVKKKLIDFKGMNDMYKSIADKYKLKILDYTNDSICLNKTNFYNGTHLNEKGAELFSTKLAKDLNTIIY